MNGIELATFMVALSSLALSILMFVLNFRQKNRHHEEDKNLQLLQSIVLNREQDNIYAAIEKVDEALSMLREPCEISDLPITRNLIEIYFNLRLKDLDACILVFANINGELYKNLIVIKEEMKTEFLSLIQDMTFTYLFQPDYKIKITDRLMNYKGRFMREMMTVKV